MTYRISAAVVAMMALATLALVPGVASAQSPAPTTAAPQVAGVVVEQTTTTTAAPQVLGQTLPRTGGDLVPMVGVALALVVLGVLLVISVRRRRGDNARLA